MPFHDIAAGGFNTFGFVSEKACALDLLLKFGRQFLSNLNLWSLFVTGDPNPEQIAHIHGTPLLPVVAGILAALGLAVVFRRRWRDPLLWRPDIGPGPSR